METQRPTLEHDKNMMNLDFVDGEAKSYFSLPKNEISTRQSTTQSTILLMIASAILQPATLCLIATIVYLAISQLAKPFGITLYAIQLGLLILANIIKNILVDRSKKQADQAINKRTVKVFRGDDQFENLYWGDVRQGDIVYLQQGQTAPADLIVLDSQEIDLRQAVTYVDNKNVNGQLVSQKKKACYLSQILNKSSNQKLYWARYRKVISGKLTYEKPTADMNNFKAYLKLSKDPKMQKLSIDNLILRQSIVKTSLWVYGLVIYAGMDSKIMKNFNEGNKNRTSLLSRTDKLFLICLAVNIILGTIFSISYTFFGQPLEKQFSFIAYHFLIFSVALPNFLYLGKDIFMIMFSLKSMENQMEVRNYTNLEQLGGINYLMISNTGVLNTGKLFVNEIVTESSVYQFKDEETFENTMVEGKRNSTRVPSKRRHGSSMKEDQFITNGQRKFLTPIYNYDKRNSALLLQEIKKQNNPLEDQEISYQIDDDTNVRFKETTSNITKLPSKFNTHLEPLKLNKKRFYNDVKRGEKQAMDILKGINLCHRAKLYYSASKGKYQGVSHVNSEEILLKLIKFIGWTIQPFLQNKNQLGLSIIEEKQKLNQETGTISFEPKRKSYFWCGINSFHFPRKLYSVVVSQNDVATLYCKGSPEDIIERLKISKETQKIIQNTVSSYEDKQSEIIIYAKRQFSQEEKEIYENDYISLKSSLTTTPQEIEAFSKQYERDLDFICIIGMSTQIDSKADEMMKQLEVSGIKTCIFSRENSDANIVRKLIIGRNSDWKDIRIEHQSIEQIKYYLNEVTNLLHSNPNLPFLLTVSGKAWKTIREDSEVVQHFLFVFYYCQSLLAVKFSSSYIAQLTNKIRNSYPEQEKVMGIGSAFTDLKFLGESNISIGMSSDLPTDIKANSLDKIIDALRLGPYFFSSRLAINSLIFYKVITTTTILLILEIIRNIQSISNTLDGEIIFFYIVIYPCIELAYHIFYFRTPVKLQDTKKYKNFKNDSQKLHLVCIEAVIHGIFIILSVHFTLPNVRIAGGKILPVQAEDMAIFLILINVNNLRNIFSKNYSKLSALIMGVISMSIMAICTVITAHVSTSFIHVASQLFHLLSSYDSITLIINTSVLCLAFSLFMEEVVKKNLLLPAKKPSKLRNNAEKKSEMIKLIKHLYKEQNDMELSMKQIVEQQMDVNRLKIDNFLQIKDQEDNLKFNYHRVSKVKNVLIKILIIQLIFLTTILIIDLVTPTDDFKGYEAALICDIVITFVAILLAWRRQMFMCYYRLTVFLVTCNTSLLLIYAFMKNDSEMYVLICFTAVIITQSISIWFPLLLIVSGIICLASILVAILLSTSITQSIFEAIFLAICFMINLHVLYKAQIDAKISFIITEAFEKENNYVNDILSILVPKFIKNHLEEKGFALQQQQKQVSILFCYVCNFDEIVKQEGKNVVPLMDELFRQFDQLCHNFAVQKIETVGQTYMAATGIKPYEDEIDTQMKKKNQVQRLLKMAIQMLQKSQSIMWGIKKNKKLKIKIGIHHGNVVIGVIGYHKPQFSLIGDTVNTTSRHCSTAEQGQVVLSEVAYKLLRKFPASAFSKTQKKMKGLGQVSVYRYLNNDIRGTNHTRVRIRFQNIVKKVIQNLKSQGKIKYQNYKALQLAQKFVRERRASKKCTRYSEARPSVQNQDLDFEEQNQNKQNKYTDLQLKYNSVLELTGKKSEYVKYILAKNVIQDRVILAILALIYLIVYFIDISQGIKIANITLSSIGLTLFPLMFLIYRKAVKNKYMNIFYMLLCCYLLLSIKLREIIGNYQDNYHHLFYLYSMIQITICSSQVAFRFLHTVILCLLSIGLDIGILAVKGELQVSIIVEIFYLCAICFRKYQILEYSYQTYSFSQIHLKKSKEQSDLVSQLLPKHAYEKLKNQNSENRLQLTDRFEKATMLFADIKGFTSYSNQTTPVGVVKMLRQLFEQFDKLCLKYNVYKVYTIGDCYVVLGFTNCYQRDYLEEAKNVVNMGIAMVETIQKVRENLNFAELDMRIGVHTGTIIGGIIGTQIVRYDIYGPDVMVANKFQEFGKIGAIHISEATKQILDQDNRKSFNIVPNGTVKVEKLNAQYNGYLLSKKKFEL